MIGTVPTFSHPSLVDALIPRHARTEAARQRVAGAAPLAALDVLVALASLATVLVATNWAEMPHGLDSFLSMRVTLRNVLLLVGFVTAWHVILQTCGLYSQRGVASVASERLRVLLGCAIGSSSALAVLPFTGGGGLRPISLVYLFLFTAGATLAVRGARRAIARTQHRRRVLIVGTGRRAQALVRRLEADDLCPYEIAGFLDTPDSTPASDVVARRTIGTLADLEALLVRDAIDEVRIALPVKSHYLHIQEAIHTCERVGVRVAYQADLFASQLAWPRYDDPTSPTVTMHVVPSDYRLVIKRALDIAGALAALTLLAPLMLVVAAAVAATSHGPVIFAQERYGLNRRRFRMFKFRTMRTDAEALQATLESRNEADGPVFKIKDDPRVTPIGRFLRRTSIDELPQFVNVLRGDMSLVGPRPLPLRDVTRFTRASDMRRFSVRPGLTCLWQISGRSSLTFADWIRLDLHYIDGWSLALDLLILVRTLPAVLSGSGAR